jgi:hypothetical protein
MYCKICEGPFTDFKFFHPETLAPLQVDTQNCGRRLLAAQMREAAVRERRKKLLEMSPGPIEVSVELQ